MEEKKKGMKGDGSYNYKRTWQFLYIYDIELLSRMQKVHQYSDESIKFFEFYS